LSKQLCHAQFSAKVISIRSHLEERVKHFSSTEWVDFARNVVTAERRTAMQEHLDQGCGTCLKIFKTWATVVEFARREPLYEPPSSAVRNAEAYFFSFRLTLKERAGVRVLRCVFDSFNLGTLSGIRASGTAPRQLMYKSGSVFVDLRVEQKPSSEWTNLAGQVVDAQRTDGTLQEISILLFSKSDAALRTTTNQSGEFNFSFKAIEHPGLLLSLKEGGLLLVLPERLAGSSMG
jgi:hypothetical protein